MVSFVFKGLHMKVCVPLFPGKEVWRDSEKTTVIAFELSTAMRI